MTFPEPQMYHIPPPGPLPPPPSMPLAMPVPQQMSRTMQYATTGDILPPPPPPPRQDLRPIAPPQITRPYSDSAAFHTSNSSHTAPSTPQRPHLQTAPTRHQRNLPLQALRDLHCQAYKRPRGAGALLPALLHPYPSPLPPPLARACERCNAALSRSRTSGARGWSPLRRRSPS
ncbi:hypothetical protein NUW54_g14751 [Trametes sanguinea]|uniref:Uncharacterized protein n=1 Tax=Trametes sanguinea TaxID=158606 RepID=A0ACC1MCF7_9APHY|nr:hypothetical protein NUW54_g14751 [Trametes sanguinea]